MFSVWYALSWDHRAHAPNWEHKKAQVSQLSLDRNDTALWQVVFRVPHLSSVSDHCTDVCKRLDQPACYSKLGPHFGHHSDLAPRCTQCHSSTHLAYDTSVCYSSTGKISAFTVRTSVGSCNATDFSTHSLCMHWNLIPAQCQTCMLNQTNMLCSGRLQCVHMHMLISFYTPL